MLCLFVNKSLKLAFLFPVCFNPFLRDIEECTTVSWAVPKSTVTLGGVNRQLKSWQQDRKPAVKDAKEGIGEKVHLFRVKIRIFEMLGKKEEKNVRLRWDLNPQPLDNESDAWTIKLPGGCGPLLFLMYLQVGVSFAWQWQPAPLLKFRVKGTFFSTPRPWLVCLKTCQEQSTGGNLLTISPSSFAITLSYISTLAV